MEEPNIFCPKCGERTMVLEWFEYKPGHGLGYAKCSKCGILDFKNINGRIISYLQPDQEDTEEMTDEGMYGLTGYETDENEKIPMEGLA